MSKTIRGGFKAQATGETLDLYIYDVISWFGVSADQVAKAVAKAGDVTTINVYINSPGGDVYISFAIYTLLARHAAKVVVYIDGIAASGASIVAMAGDTRKIAANALIMIHEPMIFMGGTASDLRKMASAMDKMKDSAIEIYAARTGVDEATIAQWVADETWFNAKEAIEEGFADEIVEVKQATVSADLSLYKNAPPELHDAASSRTKRPPSPKQFFEFLNGVFGTPDTVREVLDFLPEGDNQMAESKVQPETPAEATPPQSEADITSYIDKQLDVMFAKMKADLAPVALGEPVLLEARTTDNADISVQLEKARQEGYDQGMEYATEVTGLCELGDMPAQAAEFINAKLSLPEVRRRLAQAKAERRTPVGDAGGSELVDKKDPEAKYRQEYKDAGGEAELQVSEDEYVRSCLTSEGPGTVGK